MRGLFGNGDTTVPSISGAQGEPGAPPLGDPVKVHYVVRHRARAAAGQRRRAERLPGLRRLRAHPRRLARQPCPAGGGSYWFDSDTIGTQTGKRAGGPVTLQQAQQDGLIDLIEAGPTTGVVTDDTTPVDLTVQITGGTFSYAKLTGETQGPTQTYGPVTGELGLAPGGAVTLNGAPLAPNPTPGPGPSPTPGPSPSPTPTPTTPKKLRLVGKPKLKGRKLTLKVSVPGPGTLKAAAKGKSRVLGRAKAKPKAAGTRKLTIRFKRRPPKKVALKVTFKPAGGKLQTVKRTVRR